MGRGSYAPGLAAGITSPYPQLRQYVVSGTVDPDLDPAVTVIRTDPLAAVRELKRDGGAGGIYLIGGGKLAAALLPEIDALVLKVYPLVGGAGVPLFDGGFTPTAFRLTGTRTLDGGTVVLSYHRP